jgi:hypothetical protein
MTSLLTATSSPAELTPCMALRSEALRLPMSVSPAIAFPTSIFQDADSLERTLDSSGMRRDFYGPETFGMRVGECYGHNM